MSAESDQDKPLESPSNGEQLQTAKRPTLGRLSNDERQHAMLEAKALGLPTRFTAEGLIQPTARPLPVYRPKPRRRDEPVPILYEPFWQPQPKESNVVFNYFATYRDMVDEIRSPRKVSAIVKRNPVYISDLSRKWRWAERAHAYDVYLDVQRQLELQQARRKANEQNVKIARAVKSKLTTRLAAIDPDSLSPRDLITWFKIATEVEALALGGATARVEIDTPDMVNERRLRDAANDVVTSYKLMPDVPIEERAKWAASDYEVSIDALRKVIQTLLDEGGVDQGNGNN